MTIPTRRSGKLRWSWSRIVILVVSSSQAAYSFQQLDYYTEGRLTITRNHRTGRVLGAPNCFSPPRLWPLSSLPSDDTSCTGPSILVPAVPPLRIELRLEDGDDAEDCGDSETTVGRVVAIELTCAEDVDRTIEKYRHLLPRDGRPGEGPLDVLLSDYWKQHVHYFQKEMRTIASDVPVYKGPIPSSSMEEYEKGVVARIHIPSNGLIIEVADSTISGAGKGIFVRKQEQSTNEASGSGILQTAGSAFCGYGRGRFVGSLDNGHHGTALSESMKERTFEFRLEQGVRSSVWFDGHLMSIGEAVHQSGASHVVGHTLVFGSSDGLVDIHPTDGDDDQDNKYRYFVPLDEYTDFSSLTIQTVGHMANDLAGGRREYSSPIDDAIEDMEGEYLRLSATNNILALVPRIELEISESDRTGASPPISPGNILRESRRTLKPSGMPVMTLSQSVLIANTNVPMEVGCQYGYHYWTSS